MQDFTKFLRYVIPGLIFAVELLGYLLISGDLPPCQLKEWVKDTETAIGIAIGALLASGALGFLWGVIYYQIIECFTGLQIYYGKPFEKAQKREWIQLQELNGEPTEVPVAFLSKKDLWRVGTSYFSRRTEACKRMKGVDQKMNRFADLVHGLGTTAVGSVMAIVFFLIVNLKIYHCWLGRVPCTGGWSLVLAVIILILHSRNFYRVKKDCENVYTITLLKEFETEHREHWVPIELYVFQHNAEWWKRLCLWLRKTPLKRFNGKLG